MNVRATRIAPGALRGLLAMLATASATQIPAQAPEPSRTAQTLGKTHLFAQCLVRDLRPQAVRTLEAAPGSSAERGAVAEIHRRGRRCAESVARFDRDAQYLAAFRIAPEALRGPLAEALYERDFSPTDTVPPRALARIPAPTGAARQPARQRIGAAAPPEVGTFAWCVAVNAPETAAALLTIEPGSELETDAVRRLVSEFDFCFASAETTDINIPTVRGFIAESAYRRSASLARGEPLESGAGEQIARRGNANSGAAVIVPAATHARAATGPADGYDTEDVRRLTSFSRCIARRRPADAEELLSMDYREAAYDRTARAIASRSVSCATDGHPRFSRLLFAGGLAEELLAARQSGTQFRARASRISAQTEGGDSTEGIASCVVGGQPALVASLLASSPASAEENGVVRELLPHVANCVPPGQIARISQPSLRALIALAAYRLVQQQAAVSRPGRN